jgi:hypothetical protein
VKTFKEWLVEKKSKVEVFDPGKNADVLFVTNVKTLPVAPAPEQMAS